MTGSATWATAIIDCAFTTNPLSGSPSWTDVSSYALSFQTTRGRSAFNASTTTFDSGQATIVLDNTDGRFDPTYTSGAYYPNVIPRRRIRIQAAYGGTTYPIFDGYVNAWGNQYEWDQYEYVTVTATDAFLALSLYQYTPVGGVPQEATDARMSRVLTAVGLPTSGLDTGASQVIADATLNDLALDHLQAVATVEDGAFYIDPAGIPIFESRYHRKSNTRSVNSQATLGDSGTEIEYDAAIQTSYDDTLLYNSAQVTDGNGNVFQYADSTSGTTYLSTTLQLSTLGVLPNEGYDYAAWIVLSSKTPSLTFNGVIMDPVFNASAWWSVALGTLISDRLTVKRRPPSGNTINQDVFVEAVNMTADLVTPQWRVGFDLSPPSLSVYSFLILDTGKLGNSAGATSGVLGF